MNKADYYLTILKDIIAARDAVKKVRPNSCKCSSFVLQYEGSCQCDPNKPVRDARNRLFRLLEDLEKKINV